MVHSYVHRRKSSRNACPRPEEYRTCQSSGTGSLGEISSEHKGCASISEASKQLRRESHSIQESLHSIAAVHSWRGTGNHRQTREPSPVAGGSGETIDWLRVRMRACLYRHLCTKMST